MIKIYASAAVLLASTVGLAQTEISALAQKNISQNSASRTDINHDRAPGDIIGSVMDFSDASMWVIDNDGTDPGGWVIGADGPDGPFSGGMGPIASTSGGDFALFDADGVPGEATIRMADPIDLSAYDNVAIEFESYYRNFTGSAFFDVSIDGSTWEPFPVHDLVPLNESTENPELVSVNITEFAAEEETVWVRFRYASTDDYAWMVDDVRFTEGYNNQLVLTETFLSCGVEQLDYYRVPVSQVSPFTFGARVMNNGVNDQTSTTLNVSINEGAEYLENSSSETVPAFSMDSLAITTPEWSPAAGVYNVMYNVSSADFTDDIEADNMVGLEPITVGGNVYARDNGVSTGSVGFLGGAADVTMMGNYFEFFNPFGIGYVDVMIDGSSEAGEVVFAEVRKWDGTDFIPVGFSDDYELTAADPGTMIRIPLEDLVECEAGDVVIVGAGHYGSESVRIVTGQAAPGAVIFSGGDPFQQNSVFMIHAVQAFAGVDEFSGLEGNVEVYPNPAQEQTTVSYTLTEHAEVTATMTDISGKVVLTSTFGDQAEGAYQQTIDTQNLSEGTYFLTLNVGGQQHTTKVVVSH